MTFVSIAHGTGRTWPRGAPRRGTLSGACATASGARRRTRCCAPWRRTRAGWRSGAGGTGTAPCRRAGSPTSPPTTAGPRRRPSRAGRRRALLLALDRAADALALPEADGGGADEEPEAASARLARAEFGLDGLDGAVLLLALRCTSGSPVDGFADEALDRLREPAAAAAALLGAEPREVRRRLAPGAPLIASGLLAPTTVRYSLFGHGYDEGALALAASLPRATERALEGRAPWIEALLGRPCPPELDWADFAHVAEPAEVAVRLLRGAALSGARGVNVLLHGPVGTGKTRLPRPSRRGPGSRSTPSARPTRTATSPPARSARRRSASRWR